MHEYIARMRFLAIREDMQPNPEVWSKYVHKANVECSGCSRKYQLWAPLELNDDARVRAESETLKRELAEGCPEHEEWFHLD